MTEEEITDALAEQDPEPTEGIDAQPPAPDDVDEEDRSEVSP